MISNNSELTLRKYYFDDVLKIIGVSRMSEMLFLGTFLTPHTKNNIPIEGFEKPLAKDIFAKCNL